MEKPVGSRFGQMVSKERFSFNQNFRKFTRWNFLLFLSSKKTINNSSKQMRQLYAFVANESTLGNNGK